MSKADWSETTEAQSIIDKRFLDMVRDKYVLPLEREMVEKYPAYAGMNSNARTIFLLNHENGSGGTVLPLEYVAGSEHYKYPEVHYCGAAYAGRELPGCCIPGTVGEMRSTLGPFVDGLDDDEPFPAVFNITPDLSGVEGGHSDRYGAFSSLLGTTTMKNGEKVRPLDTLPVAFKVAVLRQYVIDNTVMSPQQAQWFVLGSVPAKPSRYTIETTSNGEAQISGYVIRIRDTFPSRELFLAIWDDLVTISSEFDSAQSKMVGPELYRSYPSVEPGLIERQRKRPNRESTAAMVAFVDKYKSEHGEIGRRGTPWETVRVALLDETGIKYQDAESLRKAYRAARKRYEDKGTLNG